MGHFWATFGLRRTKNGIILKMLSHFAVLICHITSKIHHCWFYGKFTMFFNLNMICGEFWLPIVSQNVSEIDVTLTYVSWIFNKITIILFFCVVWELRFDYPIEYCALLRSSTHIKPLMLPSPKIGQSKINSHWIAGPIEQTNRRPSVWCSKYYFF